MENFLDNVDVWKHHIYKHLDFWDILNLHTAYDKPIHPDIIHSNLIAVEDRERVFYINKCEASNYYYASCNNCGRDKYWHNRDYYKCKVCLRRGCYYCSKNKFSSCLHYNKGASVCDQCIRVCPLCDNKYHPINGSCLLCRTITCHGCNRAVCGSCGYRSKYPWCMDCRLPR